MARSPDKFTTRDWLAVAGIVGGFGLAFWGRKASAKPASSSAGPDSSPGPRPTQPRIPPRRPVPPKPTRTPTVYCAKATLSIADVDDILARLSEFMVGVSPDVSYDEGTALAFSMTREFMATLCPGYPFPATPAAVEGFRNARPPGWGKVYDLVHRSIFSFFVPSFT